MMFNHYMMIGRSDVALIKRTKRTKRTVRFVRFGVRFVFCALPLPASSLGVCPSFPH